MTKETRRFMDKLKRKISRFAKHCNGGYEDDSVRAEFAQKDIEALVKSHIQFLEQEVRRIKGGGI